MCLSKEKIVDSSKSKPDECDCCFRGNNGVSRTRGHRGRAAASFPNFQGHGVRGKQPGPRYVPGKVGC